MMTVWSIREGSVSFRQRSVLDSALASASSAVARSPSRRRLFLDEERSAAGRRRSRRCVVVASKTSFERATLTLADPWQPSAAPRMSLFAVYGARTALS